MIYTQNVVIAYILYKRSSELSQVKKQIMLIIHYLIHTIILVFINQQYISTQNQQSIFLQNIYNVYHQPNDLFPPDIIILLNNEFLIHMHSDKKPQYCNSCQSYVVNTVSMLCGHRICHNCLKSIKGSHNRQSSKLLSCLVCSHNLQYKIKKNQTNPDEQKTPSAQRKKLKQKILYRLTSPSTTHKISSNSPDKSNRASDNNNIQKPYKKFSYENPKSNENLACREHSEPLIMYEQKNKQLYCAQCLYLKNKRNANTIPIKNALDLINNENKLNRQQSRNTLSALENSIKVCSMNKSLFETTILQYNQIIQKQFEDFIKQLKKKQTDLQYTIQSLFQSKITEYNKIINDLDFLKTSIKQYRQYNKKETQNINAAIYIFSAYKIIKKTISNLDLNYIPYSLSDLSVLDLDKKYTHDFLNSYGRIKVDLPIKPYEIKISRISSLEKPKKPGFGSIHPPLSSKEENSVITHKQNKTTSPENLSTTPRKPQNNKSQHKIQFSLSRNICDPPEKNLYERLLQQKFNKYSIK